MTIFCNSFHGAVFLEGTVLFLWKDPSSASRAARYMETLTSCLLKLIESNLTSDEEKFWQHRPEAFSFSLSSNPILVQGRAQLQWSISKWEQRCPWDCVKSFFIALRARDDEVTWVYSSRERKQTHTKPVTPTSHGKSQERMKAEL